jgi:hypothetical protein
MSRRADILRSAEQYPRHCFADISVDHHEFGRWQYRNELRGKNASPLLPVIDANVVTESFGTRVGYEIGRKAREFLCEVVRHCFPAFVGASSAQGKFCNGSAQVANTILSHATNVSVPVSERNKSRSSFATERRA